MVVSAFTDAARDILQPAIQQMGEQAAQQAVNYAKEQGPKLMREQVLPKVMEATGAEQPGDVVKQGIGKVGESISDSGGITGVAGKLMSKMGKGKGGGTATGYGQKRRMPVQQDVWVSASIEDTYKGWTEYSRWTEFMHRANQVDPEMDDEDDGGSARLTVTEKMWGFKRPFTSEVVSQVPNEHIRWKSTKGTKHVGVIAFHGVAPRLTLISVNIDHAPSGPIEKIARGARFDKRAIRADLHRFKGWIEHKSPDELEEIEGWMGTIEDGEIVQSHGSFVSQQEEESDGGQGEEGQEDAGERGQQPPEGVGEGGQEGGEEAEEGSEEDQEDRQEIEADASEEDESEDDEEEDEEDAPEAEQDEQPEAEQPEEQEEPEPEAKPQSKSAKKRRSKVRS